MPLRWPATFLFLAIASTSAAQWLEFCDDLTKPCCCERDPYEERIETERHDFTQSAVTVGRGVAQVEAGYTYFYKQTDQEKESAHTTPEVLLRLGLTEDIEARLRWNHAWKFIDEEEDRVGAEDLRYSLKFQITRQPCCGWRPTSALEVRGTAPTGGDAFSTDQAEFGLDYIYQWELAEGIVFAGSTGYATNALADFGLVAEESDDDNFNTLTQSFALGLEASESNTIYIEWFGLWSDGRETEFNTQFLNVGIDHYVTDDFVIDFRVGAGLTDDSDDVFTGVGGGYRY